MLIVIIALLALACTEEVIITKVETVTDTLWLPSEPDILYDTIHVRSVQTDTVYYVWEYPHQVSGSINRWIWEMEQRGITIPKNKNLKIYYSDHRQRGPSSPAILFFTDNTWTIGLEPMYPEFDDQNIGMWRALSHLLLKVPLVECEECDDIMYQGFYVDSYFDADEAGQLEYWKQLSGL